MSTEQIAADLGRKIADRLQEQLQREVEEKQGRIRLAPTLMGDEL